MRSASSPAEDAPAVMWRDGVHIAGTSIWCDARRARDVCFVSAAHAIDSARHGQLIATQETLALLAPSQLAANSQLAVPCARPFTLGTLRLELVRSGLGPGAASLAVDVAGTRILYAPAIGASGGLGGDCDLRRCDVLVLDSTYGMPAFAFPSRDEAVAACLSEVAAIVAAGGAAVLLVTSPSKGLDVLVRLAEAGVAIAAHRAIHQAAQRLRPLMSLPAVRRIERAAPPAMLSGHAVVWPLQRRAALDTVPLPPNSRVVLVSGAAVEPAAVAAARADAAIAWSNRADYAALGAYADASGAALIYTVGAHAESFAQTLASESRVARPLQPPRQMPLFEAAHGS